MESRDEPFEGVPFYRIILGGAGYAILRSLISIALYFVAGLLGLLVSWIYGIYTGRRSIMIGYPKATAAMSSLGTSMHAIILLLAYFRFELSPYPFWWPL